MKTLSIAKIREPIVMTLGSFDGIHLGHKSLLELLVVNSKTSNSKSLILSFEPHPKKVIRPETKINLLTNFDEKIHIFNELGIDYFSILEFNKEIANMAFDEFYEDIIFKNLNIKHIITGFNHEFGRNREGNFDSLKSMCAKRNIEITSVAPMYYKGSNISSTRIRKSILKGSLAEANEMLGHTYFLIGKVVQGKNIGNKIGFPTANIRIIHPDKVIPLNGVYFTKTSVNGNTFWSMTNIGINPTFGDGQVSIETNIFDFNDDIYDKDIKISFISRIREEIKFNNANELIEMLKKDHEICLELSKKSQ
ncbi:MAG: bifunctional riboflavin kinase/FAD synthetase [Candidatus Delongbacteria bacterium]|jgi:riboflavin kinase/FMN adenylyltransferase|nr:bifunctional riboflavin kinase/FAD synthetase [Candidatus Delongbacteria bacterium]